LIVFAQCWANHELDSDEAGHDDGQPCHDADGVRSSKHLPTFSLAESDDYINGLLLEVVQFDELVAEHYELQDQVADER